MPTFDTLQGSVNLRAQSTAQATGGSDALALVGGYDATAASASANDPVTATDAQTIADAFGPDSELARASRLALANGAGTVVAVAVPETTDETETFSAASSGQLANAPIFDPSLHAEHEVTATDTTSASSVTVEVSYEDSPSAPSDADTIRLNPINGTWTADASSDYEITYDYGTYTDAIQTAATQPARYVGVLTEAAGPKATVLTELVTEAENGSYKRAVTGATPESGTGEVSGYTPAEQDYRLIEVAPARATGAGGSPVRTLSVFSFLFPSPPFPSSFSLPSSPFLPLLFFPLRFSLLPFLRLPPSPPFPLLLLLSFPFLPPLLTVIFSLNCGKGILVGMNLIQKPIWRYAICWHSTPVVIHTRWMSYSGNLA